MEMTGEQQLLFLDEAFRRWINTVQTGDPNLSLQEASDRGLKVEPLTAEATAKVLQISLAYSELKELVEEAQTPQ